MAYREVTMTEVHEIIRQWLDGVPIKRIAARLSFDPKTVRRYVGLAKEAGLDPAQTGVQPSQAVLEQILALARPARPSERGESWEICDEHRTFIKQKLDGRVRLKKVQRLLRRRGIDIPYTTLHRFAVAELDFGHRRVTMPVADAEPGQEIQLDTGWVLSLEPDQTGRRRRVRAWIFTPVLSRYRFVYPCFRETTQTAIQACEAAWEFYGGVFAVLIPDNTKTIIDKADPLGARINDAFLEYAQARGFHIDPTRVRSPRDKGRVERSVRDVRDDCFGGEVIKTVEQAYERAVVWASQEYGLRRHTTTARMPKEHFETDELAKLLPVPTEPFDIPTWHDPKVGADHLAAVEKSTYSLPTLYCRRRLRARADSQTVRFYDRNTLVKTHPRVAAGKKSIDASDFPEEKTPYAMRDVDFLERQAAGHGEVIGKYAHKILSGPLPWTRMRQARALLSLVKKYGAERVSDACQTGLALDMLDVRRLRRMLEIAQRPAPETPCAKVIPIARYLREPAQYALPLAAKRQPKGEDDK